MVHSVVRASARISGQRLGAGHSGECSYSEIPSTVFRSRLKSLQIVLKAVMSLRGQSLYEFGPFQLDHAERRLSQQGRAVPLTPKAFQTLLVLVENSGRVVDKEELLKKVWPDTFVEEATLAQNVFTLRKQLGDDRSEAVYIETVPKRGYRFVAPVRLIELAQVKEPVAQAPDPVKPKEGLSRQRKWLIAGIVICAVAVTAGYVTKRFLRPA